MSGMAAMASKLANKAKDAMANATNAAKQKMGQQPQAAQAQAITPQQKLALARDKDDSKMPVLNITFNKIYQLMLILIGVLYGFMVVLGITDLYLYYVYEARQQAKLLMDPNLINQDTTDVQAFRYISTNQSDEEPYNIFFAQKIGSNIFLLIGITIIMMGIHIGLFMGFKIYAALTDGEFNDVFNVDSKVGAGVVIVGVATVILNTVYKKYFIMDTQANLKRLQDAMGEIKNAIYDNVTANPAFLTALWQSDTDGIVRIIKDEIGKNSFKKCSNHASFCDREVEKLVFTLNFFSFMRMQIPENDAAFDSLRKMLSPEGITARNTDVTQLFYYRQSVYIPNMYSIIRDQVRPSFVGPDKKMDVQREKVFSNHLTQLMQDINLRLGRLYSLSDGKENIANYMWKYFFYSMLFMLFLMVVFWHDVFKRPVEYITEWLSVFFKRMFKFV